MLSSPQTPYTGGLRAFGATRVCHPGVTGGPHLAEKVVPSEPVADNQTEIAERGIRVSPGLIAGSGLKLDRRGLAALKFDVSPGLIAGSGLKLHCLPAQKRQDGTRF